VAESLVVMTEIVLPEDSNARGFIFGGRVLALVDKCAAIVAIRHTRSQVVTASLDSVDFKSGVRVGNILVLHGRLNAVFNTSMEIEIEVHSEDPLSGARHLTTRAFVTMVAMGPDGSVTTAPPLTLVSEDERMRAADAATRRRQRIARRA
jgi:acyl-CoA hydrolase